jgi:predicted amidohydrolase
VGPVADPRSEVPPGHVRVAGIVLKWLSGDKRANLERIEPRIREAAAHGAAIVCTTESFLDGYAVADRTLPDERFRELGEPVPGGEHYARLAALADELDIYLVAGLTEARGEERYNAAVVVGPDGQPLGSYHKQRLGHEVGRNLPGETNPVFSTPYGNLGLMICGDRRDPSIAGGLRAGGAALILCPSGGMSGRRNDRIVQQRSRENGVPIVFVHPAEFLATGADGTVLARALRGRDRWIRQSERDGRADSGGVFYVDLPLPERRP